jgi:hypothetical protein
LLYSQADWSKPIIAALFNCPPARHKMWLRGRSRGWGSQLSWKYGECFG